ncbi:MAG: hypothetical protein U0165_00780 [Polyangiaceae bacterium]
MRRLRGSVALSVALAVGVPSLVSTNHPAFAQPGKAAVATSAPVIVLALDGAADVAWSLARLVYEDPAIRPSIDDTKARILAGDPAPKDADPKLRELADLRSAVHGDDAPSRRILSSIASEFSAQAILVVWPPVLARPAEARLFVVKDAAFDAAILRPDASPHVAPLVLPSASSASSSVVMPSASSSASPSASSSGASSASAAASASAVPVLVAVTPAHHDDASWIQAKNAVRARLLPGLEPAVVAPPATSSSAPAASTAFWSSPWFWGALGLAVVGGAGIYLGSKSSSDSSSSTVELKGRVVR